MGVFLAYQYSRRLERERQKTVIRGVLQALETEIEALWQRYYETIGVQVEELEEGKPFDVYWIVGHDYFTIYTSNASLIGQIESDDVRASIVRTYTLGRSLIDSFRMSNDLVMQRRAVGNAILDEQDSRRIALYEQHTKGLVQYAAWLQAAHREFIEQKDETLVLLRKQK